MAKARRSTSLLSLRDGPTGGAPRVLYTLPDGVQSTVLLRTALLDTLTSSGDIDWTFVSPLSHDAEFADEFARPGCRLLAWPEDRPGFIDRQLFALRQEIWRQSLNNSTTQVFSARLRWSEPKRWHVHRRLARLLRWLPGARRGLAGIESCIVGDGVWGGWLDSLDPDAVVLGSAGIKLAEMTVARAAVRRGIPLYGIVPSWDNLTGKGPLAAKCDRLAVWNASMREEAVRLYGYAADNVEITGPPAFDGHHVPVSPTERQRFFSERGLDPSRRLIVYASVPRENCRFSYRFAELLAGWMQDESCGEPAQLLVRLHPQDDVAAFDHLNRMRHVVVERPGRYDGDAAGQSAIMRYKPTAADARGLTMTLACADVVVNVASTITLEACLLDRPVVNLAFNLEDGNGYFSMADYFRTVHFAPIVESRATAVVRSPEELRRAVREAFEHPEIRTMERAAIVKQFDRFRDGQAAVRLGQSILRFARRGRTSTTQQPRQAA